MYLYIQILSMRSIGIVIILAIASNCQVSPNWLQDIYVQAFDVTIINTDFIQSGTFTRSITYQTSMVTPYVILSIRQFRAATNNGNIGIISQISGVPAASSFTHMLTVASPTEIWLFVIRYFAYEGNYPELSFIKLQFMDKNPANIDGSAPATATQTYTSIITATAGNTYCVAVFTTGFIGQINPNFFQGNVTYTVPAAGGAITITTVVPSDTKITRIAFYILAADVTSLAIASEVFVESAVTRATYGIQGTFYTPSKVRYDANYISGMVSWSIRNNVQYNLTISGLNFTTFTDSFYNEVSHFNLWIRVCPNPYSYYNKVDMLCYPNCPAGTYQVTGYLTCEICQYSCATCTTGTSCTTCPTNRVLDSAGTFCACKPYFYEYNQVCYACHYSCLTCDMSGQYFNCLTCQSTMNRVQVVSTILGANFTCDCDVGYYDNGYTSCKEICGDGRVITDQCDDGNTVDNDGCSKTCYTQNGFTCTNSTYIAPNTNPSTCYYTANITITVARIEKDPLSNIAQFFLQISPLVPALDKLSYSNIFTNISGANFYNVQLKDGYLVCNVSYTTSIEGLPIMIGLIPSATGLFSQFAPQNTTAYAIAQNGQRLDAYTYQDYYMSGLQGSASYIVGLTFMFFGLIFCFGDWKQIGLQLFFSIQYCFMSFAVLEYFSPYINQFMKIKPIMGWNQILGQIKPPYLAVPVTYHMGFSESFQYNFNIMAVFPGFALIMYLVYRIAQFAHDRRRKQGKSSKKFEQVLSGKLLKYFKFDFFVYWMLFNMQQILMATVIQFQGLYNPPVVIFIILSLAGILICILGLFIRPKSLTAYREALFHKSYGNRTFLIVLISILLLDLLLVLGIKVSRYIFYVSLALPLIVLIYVIVRRPFKLIWNNIRLAIIEACVLCTIALQIAILNTDYAINYKFSLGVIILIGICIFVTFMVIVFYIVKKICELKNKDLEEFSSQKSSVREEEQLNEKVRQAGFALVNGYQQRLPTSYQMTNMPSRLNKSKLDSYRVKPTERESAVKSTRNNLRNVKEDNNDVNDLRRKMRESPRQMTPKNINKSRMRNALGDQFNNTGNTLTNQDITPVRQETQQRTNNLRRNRDNPYQQILQQTVNTYK